LKERPSGLQWFGILIFILGGTVYFLPAASQSPDLFGLALAGITVLANAVAAVLGRSVNRGGEIPPMVVTVISMGVGAIMLLGIGLYTQGFPPISLSAWAVIFWLAVVNTALAFFLWNKTLQVLSAVESSIINNTMLIQIAVLAWIYLGEQITLYGAIGLVLAAVGILFVNLKPT
jgi:drug/metabolite transporter (DMT)-like permease